MDGKILWGSILTERRRLLWPCGKPIYKLHNPDQEIIVRKTIVARMFGLVFPAVGAGNPPNIPDNGAMPDQSGLGNAVLGMNPFQETGYNAATNTSGFTLAAAQITGAAQNFLNLTGTLTAAANAQLPTVPYAHGRGRVLVPEPDERHHARQFGAADRCASSGSRLEDRDGTGSVRRSGCAALPRARRSARCLIRGSGRCSGVGRRAAVAGSPRM